MWGILKKDLRPFVLNVALIVPGMWIYFLGTYDALEPGIACAAGALLFLVLFGPVLHNEMTESRDSGYLFLSILPLTRARLVAGKFALPLLTALVYVPLAFAMFSRLDSTPASFAFARAYVLVSFAVSLATIGLYYVGLFRFGFSALFRWLPIVLVVLPFLAAIGFDRAIQDLARGDTGRLALFFESPLPYVAAGAGLVVYAALMRFAAATKEISR